MVFIGSLFIGMIIALMIAFVMKRSSAYKDENKDDPNLNTRQQNAQNEHAMVMEVSMMLACPYTSYLIAEGLQLSGICSILINGIFLSYYCEPNL